MIPTEIIGFDPGLRHPAVAAIHPKTGAVLRVASFDGTCSTGLDMGLRAHGIALLVSRWILAEPGPKVVGIEGPAYVKQKRASMEQMARCRQALYSCLACLLPDVTFLAIPPTSVKLGMAGKGNASKLEVYEAVVRTYDVNLSMTKDDMYAQSDAIAIAHCTYNRWRRHAGTDR